MLACTNNNRSLIIKTHRRVNQETRQNLADQACELLKWLSNCITISGLQFWHSLLLMNNQTELRHGQVEFNPFTPTLGIRGWASECLDVKNYKWQLNLVWHRMLYSCTPYGKWVSEQCFTSPPTQYRLYGRWSWFTGQKTQPTVSKYWRRCYKKERKQRKQLNTHIHRQ